jgi:hypothetical protein
LQPRAKVVLVGPERVVECRREEDCRHGGQMMVSSSGRCLLVLGGRRRLSKLAAASCEPSVEYDAHCGFVYFVILAGESTPNSFATSPQACLPTLRGYGRHRWHSRGAEIIFESR